jgi:hypothetical protein
MEVILTHNEGWLSRPFPKEDFAVARIVTQKKKAPSPAPPEVAARNPIRKGRTPNHGVVDVIAALRRSLSRPGIDRESIFGSATGKTVYAFSILPENPDLLIREDVDGKRTIGRLVKGRFRPVSVASKRKL